MNTADTNAYELSATPRRRPVGQLALLFAEVALLLLGGLALFVMRPGVPAARDAPPLATSEAKPRAGSNRAATTVVLVAESEDAAAALRALFSANNVIGRRGEVTVGVVVAPDENVLQGVTAMILANEGMCPHLSCGQALLIDMRAR